MAPTPPPSPPPAPENRFCVPLASFDGWDLFLALVYGIVGGVLLGGLF